ncbi:glutamate racemase [bacterium]|nr:glutamate racemase [bacterium]
MTEISQRPIGVFDSGIGGLTVVHELLKQVPAESIVYFGDTARVPYGTKSAEAVRRFALQDAAFLAGHGVKMIVVACHTASSAALGLLDGRFSFPVLGVTEPGVQAALRKTTGGRIGVIGTRGTVQSGIYVRSLTEKNRQIQVWAQACPLFVPLAEEGWLDGDVTREIARIYLEPMIQAEVDTLILACTHYPLLKNVIAQVMGDSVQLIDSAEETARVVKQCLDTNMIASPGTNPAGHRFYVSDIPIQFQEVGERFLGRKLGSVQQVDIESIRIDEPD